MSEPLTLGHRRPGLLSTTTPSSRSSSLLSSVLLLAILLLAFGLRCYRLGDQSVWWDEGLAAWAARQSLTASGQWTSADVHPPLYFWLLHFWRMGSGDSEFGLRFLSVIVGVLTAAAIYQLGRALAGPQVGLLAALLVGISPFDVWWSQEMRMYALAALWASLTLWAAVRFWDSESAISGVSYVLLAAAGLYTLYLQASVLVVVNLAWLWMLAHSRRRWRELACWGVAQVAVLVLFAPWLGYALGRIPTWSTASSVQPGVFLRIYWTVLTVGIPVDVERYWPLSVPVLAVMAAGLGALLWTVRSKWRIGRNVGLLALSLLLPATVVYLVSLPRKTFFYAPQLAPRYLLLFAPAFYVLLAWGLLQVTQNRHWAWRVALVAVVVAAPVYGLSVYYAGRIRTDDYPSLAATLRAYQRPDDAVVLYTDQDWPVFAYHYPGRWYKVPHALQVTAEAADAYMSPIWEEHDGVWLVVTPYATVNDAQGEIPAWFAARAVGTVEHRFVDKILRFYARTEERARLVAALAPGSESLLPLHIDVADGVRLSGYEQQVREYRNGDTIHLFLYIERDGQSAPDAADGITVSLVSWGRACGPAWKQAQVPWPSSDSLSRQQVDLVVPPDAPVGRYAFAVGPNPGREEACFGEVWLRPWQQAASAARNIAITNPLQVDFGSGVRLLGYDLPAEGLTRGGTVALTLYWQAQQPIEQRYKVFTHLLGEVFNADSGSFLWGQQDNEPVSGTRPTSTWRSGEVIVDRYAIPLSPSMPSGGYAIEVGLYDPATVERLPVLDDQGQAVADHVILTRVAID